jgi:alcohol dehydrogenase class IV
MARVAAFLGAGRTANVAEAVTGVADAINRTMAALNVQTTLKEYNIPLDKMTAAAEAARNLDFITNSPWTVSGEEVFKILKEIL